MEDLPLSKKFEMEMLFRTVDSVQNIEELKKLTKDVIRQNIETKYLISKIGKVDLEEVKKSIEEK
jgi:hypothetical protein